ncbi:MAG: thioredoxin [Endomicrobiales bacterium]|nr:thioredoxin [Endomicrobiales bacterium]
MMSEIALNEKNFESEVLDSKLPVLIDFWAPWCGPCKMIAPVVEQIAREYEGKMKVGKINTDENMELSTKYQVTSIPTLLIIKEGKVVNRIVGYKSKNELVNLVNDLVK